MKKNILIIILVILVVATGIMVVVSKKNQGTDSTEEKITYQNQTVYININPLIKIDYEESFKKCDDESSSKICSEITTKIIDVEYLNNDAKRIYNNINIANKDIYEGIKKLIEKAEESSINTSIIDITCTSGNFLVDKLGLSSDTTINYVLNPNITDEEILNGSAYRFTVTFDSDNGSSIISQTVNLNEKVTIPEMVPTKEGYMFVEWQLDGKTYDFDSPVTGDLILKAAWTEIRYYADDEVEQ